MAYMSQEKKSKIAAALKSVVPTSWKYSLAVRNHSTIVMTVASAPFDLLAAFKPAFGCDKPPTYLSVNTHHIGTHCQDECLAEVLQKIADALNLDNHDNSDLMTDYFDVGHYVELTIGRWDKPFVFTAPALALA